MLKKKDLLIIAVVLLAAVALFAGSKMLPKTDLSTKTADVTLAPDAIEYLDETPAPDAPEAIRAICLKSTSSAILIFFACTRRIASRP